MQWTLCVSIYLHVFWLFFPKFELEHLSLASKECHELESSVRPTEKSTEINNLELLLCPHAGPGLGTQEWEGCPGPLPPNV